MHIAAVRLKPDKVGNELNIDCLCLGFILLVTYKLLLIYYCRYY